MPRYIDAELLESKYREGTDPQDPYSEITYLMPEDVESVPTADVEPVRHGRWEDLYVGDRQEEGFICTVCKEPCKCDFDYCPHCGAKMDGGEQE